MVIRIEWSRQSKIDRKEIFTYWNNHNKSKNYSRKLNYLFNKHIGTLYDHPEIGKPTDIKNLRFLIVRDYMIFYEYLPSIVSIVRIWDSKRDPKIIDSSLKK